jgi:thimet oligopeptidase
MIPRVHGVEDIQKIFPDTPQAVTRQTDALIERSREQIKALINQDDKKRTFDSTVQALDTISADISTLGAALHTLQMVHPDEAMRNEAYRAIVTLHGFIVDELSYNKAVYDAIKSYANERASEAELSKEEQRYIDETLKDFEQSGLNLPEAEQEELKELKKRLATLTMDFDTNINNDASYIVVSRDELAGLSDDFVGKLEQRDDGYVLGVDYPTFHAVMEECSVSSTRYQLWKTFMNRAYPANEQLLKKIIALRDQIATKLGFASYAHLDITDQMAESPERVQKFLDDLLVVSDKKIAQEFDTYKKHAPDGVTLTKAGQFKPWDLGYTKSQYKKKHLALDEQVVAEYFPMEDTVNALLRIYERFMGVQFKQLPIDGLWHPDVRYIAVYKDDACIGHLLLDLFPRPNKYSHACQIGTVPAVKQKGTVYPAVVTVLANFPKSYGDTPALLKRDDVITFFHEFGHAMHSVLGQTQMSGFAGTHVKTDFVEMPSQMLEEWMYEGNILKQVSSHYKTGEPLPDETIERIKEVKQFDSGYFVQRQVGLSKLSLACYAKGEEKDPVDLQRKASAHIDAYIAPQDENHFTASFGHLTGYGAKYYSYLWSKVFALDMFAKIQKQGLLNPDIGEQYVNHVLSKGGSVDPNELLKTFLGRDPNMDAFVQRLGL